MYSISLMTHPTNKITNKWDNWQNILTRDGILTVIEAFAWRDRFKDHAATLDFNNCLYALEIRDADKVIWNKLLEPQNAS